MQLFQDLGELGTHGGDLPSSDNLPKSLEYYGARIGRDLGRLHELTEGKITIGFIVEMATMYEAFVNKGPEHIPDLTPEEIFERDVIPFMKESEVIIVEAINESTD